MDKGILTWKLVIVGQHQVMRIQIVVMAKGIYIAYSIAVNYEGFE